MQWEDANSSGWALQSLPPKLVNKLTQFMENSDNLIVDIDSIFHALGFVETFPLDVLVLMPGLGAIIREGEFGDNVPMKSQDFLPFEGMGRYRLEENMGNLTLTAQRTVNWSPETKTAVTEDDDNEFVYTFENTIRNPEKLRELVIDSFPSLNIDVGKKLGNESDVDVIFCAVSCSRGYCDILGVYQQGMAGIENSDVTAAAESVDLIISAIHEIAFKLSKFRVTIHSSIYDRIANENISIPVSFLGKDAGLEYPMCVRLSDKICDELKVIKNMQITIFRDQNYLYFTAESPTTVGSILRIKFEDATNSSNRITGVSLRNAFSKSMAINRSKDGVSNYSFNKTQRNWRIGEDKVGSRLGIGLHLATLNSVFEDKSGPGEKWKMKIVVSNALLFQKLAPAMVHLCLARFDPSMRGEIRVIEAAKRRKLKRNKTTKNYAKYYNWGDDKIRYIVPSIDGSRSKHWVNSHVRRMRISNPKTIDYYRKREFPLNKIGKEIFGFRVIKGHYRGIGDLGDDFDYKFGKTPNYYSQKSIRWLRSIESSHNISIQNAERGGELRIPIGESFIQVDGWCKSTNTIFEFHGSYWHGNPKIYDSEKMNTKAKKTFGELYEKTLKREELIRTLGFNLVVMWESDWDRIESGEIGIQPNQRVSF